MFQWQGLRVLCVGGAGQTGREICRQLGEKGVATVVVHDREWARARRAVLELEANGHGTQFVASAGDLFEPASMKTWEFVAADSGFPRVCRETRERPRADRLETLIDARLGALTPDVVKESLIWNLVRSYRPAVVVDTINTATVLGYAGDLIQGGRTVAAHARRILDALGCGDAIADLRARLAKLSPDECRGLSGDIAELLGATLRMTASLDVACMIRYVQCLHALFCGDAQIAIPEFRRYVKVHTTGLGGMGFNIRYTHGDTGEPGLSTKLLGKVCATGSFTQLLLTLAHTPGCDVRVVVPATLVGWMEPTDARITEEGDRVLPLVDCQALVACDGSVTLGEAIQDRNRGLVDTQGSLMVPHLSSGENRSYALEDIATVTALGQMGCITKEEVSRAAVECIAGDSRYDVLTAIDSALLLPTQTASVELERKLNRVRSRVPSVSLGNLGPTTAKLLYEIEILRAVYETVDRIAREADELDMTLRACSYLLGSDGAALRRQILSLGIPIFLRKGPGAAGFLLGNRLLYPDRLDPAALRQKLDASDATVQTWLATGWIDLTGSRMAWWRDRFAEVHASLENDRAVSRNWFDPKEPFRAGQLLAYLYSISGGQRKQYQ